MTDHTQAFQDTTLEHIDEFAREGLRTMCFSYRKVDPDYYHEWAKRFHAANKVGIVIHTRVIAA